MAISSSKASKDKEIMATKPRNYSVVTKLQSAEIAEKTSKEAILDHSDGVFIVFVVILGLYRQLFVNCRRPDSLVGMLAFDSIHFLLVLAVVLTAHVRSAWTLIGGKAEALGLS